MYKLQNVMIWVLEKDRAQFVDASIKIQHEMNISNFLSETQRNFI